MEENKSSKSIVVLIIIVLIAIAVVAYFGLQNNWFSRTATPAPIPEEATEITGKSEVELASTRIDVLNRVKNSAPLTEVERTELVNLLIGDQILYYGFTEAEKQQIIDKLNE